jgi:hypothetical protein
VGGSTGQISLVEEPRLAYSCLADHRHERGHLFAGGHSAGRRELPQLLVPAHEGHIETQRQRAHRLLRGSQHEAIGTGTFGFDGGHG